VRVPPHLYAVFHHAEHISTIRRTMHAIYASGCRSRAYEPADAPFFERYGPEFDPRTGEGGLEIVDSCRPK
jgi:AraC family transcriptional regulator